VEVVPVRRDKGEDVAVPAPFTPGQPRSPEDLVRVLQAEGIRDRRVLAAFGKVPRARFVPPAATGQAYLDAPIRIPHGQVTTQPSLIARMVAALGLTGSEQVLEVGTGLGFQTAILALLARQVVSVERFADLAAQAQANLAAVGLDQVRVVVGDGTLGIPEHAPYQAIVVAAASPRIPPPLIQQLAPGGRLVHPVGPGGHEQVTAFHKETDQLVTDAQLTPAYFVPLVGAHGIRSWEDRDER
jgi:protein-L-isoaspartate(D-aspartate) O-methyltransferase